MFQQHRHARRGFTLMEVMVVVAITGILVSLAVFGLRGVNSDARLSSVAREFTGDLRTARTYASTHAGFPAGFSTRSARVVVTTPTSWSIQVLDSLGVALTVASVDLVRDNADNQIQITAPDATTPIVFKDDGTVATGFNPTVTIRDTEINKQHQITISLAGSIQIVD